MLISSVPFTFAIAAGLTWLCTGLLIPVLSKSFMDQPNERSSHKQATPRGGGISFVLIGCLINFLEQTGPMRWIPIICLPLALVGLIDDFRGVPAIIRYIVQLITAAVIVNVSDAPLSIGLSLAFVIVITAIINFTNFMDGLDGLVAGCGLLLMASSSYWAIAGAIFGFLIWNWSPAKIFMGDVGSTFIGSVFGGALLQSSDFKGTVGTFLIAFPIIADAFICVCRRFINGEVIFSAHRKHLFQRLHQSGWSHQNVALLYIGAVGTLLFSYKFIGFASLYFIILCQILIGLFLERYVAAKF